MHNFYVRVLRIANHSVCSFLMQNFLERKVSVVKKDKGSRSFRKRYVIESISSSTSGGSIHREGKSTFLFINSLKEKLSSFSGGLLAG